MNIREKRQALRRAAFDFIAALQRVIDSEATSPREREYLIRVLGNVRKVERQPID